jgi:hypothetical protein
MKTEVVDNAYHIKVKKICASCKHKLIMNSGVRICQKMEIKVEQQCHCRLWEMTDGLKNAGLQNGGVVRHRGTKEIIIK